MHDIIAFVLLGMLQDVNHVILFVFNVVEMTSVEDADFARRDSTGRAILTAGNIASMLEDTQATDCDSATLSM